MFLNSEQAAKEEHSISTTEQPSLLLYSTLSFVSLKSRPSSMLGTQYKNNYVYLMSVQSLLTPLDLTPHILKEANNDMKFHHLLEPLLALKTYFLVYQSGHHMIQRI